MTDPTTETRDDFPYRIEVPTRWSDNDMLGHVNNVLYYRFFEAVVVRFQMEEAGVDWLTDAVSPQAVETLCRFHRPLSFPETVEATLRVERVGRSSVTFTVALFAAGHPHPAASGHFVHVFVDAKKLVAEPIPDDKRAVYGKFTRSE